MDAKLIELLTLGMAALAFLSCAARLFSSERYNFFPFQQRRSFVASVQFFSQRKRPFYFFAQKREPSHSHKRRNDGWHHTKVLVFSSVKGEKKEKDREVLQELTAVKLERLCLERLVMWIIFELLVGSNLHRAG